jgi:hypothetical protein
MDSININRKMHLEREVIHVQMLMDQDGATGRELERYMHVLAYITTQLNELKYD